MEKFKVSVWFNPQDIIVTARSAREAKKKAYSKIKKTPALKYVNRKFTDVWG